MPRLALSVILLLGAIASAAGIAPSNAKSSAGLTPVNILQCPGGDRCIAPDTAVDSAGNIHMVYGTTDKMACYVRSSDNGATWSTPVVLNGAQNVTTTMGERGPRIAASYSAASNQLILHVVWADLWFSGAHTFARYSQSTDGGLTWSAPTQASDVPAIDGLTVTAGSVGGVDVCVVVCTDQTVEAQPPAPRPLAVRSSFTTPWRDHRLPTPRARRGSTLRSRRTAVPRSPSPRPRSGGVRLIRRTRGSTITFPAAQVTASLAPGEPVGPIPSCSMCMTRARVVGGRVLFALRTAADDIRDHFLLNGTLPTISLAPMEATRVPTTPPW